MKRLPPLFEFRNVTVSREGRIALDAIRFSIEVEEHLAVLGPNSSQKSSLIKAIPRECYPLLRPGASLRILGRQVWNLFELRSLLGIVSNDLMQACTRDFSGQKMVLSGFFSSVGIGPHHTVTPAMEQKAAQILDLLEIPHLAGRSVNEISSGEARHMLISKALVLDEPTNSLDVHATHELRTILRKIAHSGTSLVLVTHHLSDIVPEIQRVICLKAGGIVQDGPKDQVPTSATSGDLSGTPVEVDRRDRCYHLWQPAPGVRPLSCYHL